MRAYFPMWAKRAGSPISTIGQQLNSLVIPVDGPNSPTWGYHTQHNTRTVHLRTTVLARPGRSLTARKKNELDLVSDGVAAVRRVPPRRSCPCGSGKKYR